MGWDGREEYKIDGWILVAWKNYVSLILDVEYHFMYSLPPQGS